MAWFIAYHVADMQCSGQRHWQAQKKLLPALRRIPQARNRRYTGYAVHKADLMQHWELCLCIACADVFRFASQFSIIDRLAMQKSTATVLFTLCTSVICIHRLPCDTKKLLRWSCFVCVSQDNWPLCLGIIYQTNILKRRL